MFQIHVIKRRGPGNSYGCRQEFEYVYDSPVIPQKGEFINNGFDEGTVINIRHIVRNGKLDCVNVYLDPYGVQEG